MFGNAHFRGDTVRTFAACEKLWNEASNRKKAKGSITLGCNTELWKYNNRYEVTFHGNAIVEYYPDHIAIFGGGYASSITTQGRIRAFAGVRIGNDSRCGFEDTSRINGYPFFDGIRVDNFGRIFPEDIRPDRKQVVRHEVSLQYTRLWRELKKQIAARYGIGEFDNRTMPTGYARQRAFEQLTEQLEKGEWLDTAAVTQVLGPVSFHKCTFDKVIAQARDDLRDWYYRDNDGYEIKEISNV